MCRSYYYFRTSDARTCGRAAGCGRGGATRFAVGLHSERALGLVTGRERERQSTAVLCTHGPTHTRIAILRPRPCARRHLQRALPQVGVESQQVSNAVAQAGQARLQHGASSSTRNAFVRGRSAPRPTAGSSSCCSPQRERGARVGMLSGSETDSHATAAAGPSGARACCVTRGRGRAGGAGGISRTISWQSVRR